MTRFNYQSLDDLEDLEQENDIPRRSVIKRRNSRRSSLTNNETVFGKLLNALNRGAQASKSIRLNSTRRKLPLTFVPPSTKSPLFVYNNAIDNRSFLSLCSSSHLNSERESALDDNQSVSTFRSLPSILEHSPEPEQYNWLLEENERRFSERRSIRSSFDEEDNLLPRTGLIFKGNQQARRASSIISQILVDQQEEDEEDFDTETVDFKYESKKLVRYSIPLIITFVLEQLFSVVVILTVARIGKIELAAASLGSMTATITLAVFEGISTALDTLCPQAYGSGNTLTVGVHLQRCTYFALAISIPTSLVWFNISHLLQHIVSDPEVLRLTQQYLRISILGVPAYIMFENGKRFLQAQSIFDAGTIILFITAPLNLLTTYLLVWNRYIGLGFVGAPIATVINFWLMVFFLVLYVLFIDGKKCWGGFTREALTQWGDLSKLAIPGILMLEAEYFAYEILTLFASSFGTTALAAQSAVSTLASLTYMVPFAIGIASATRVANFIGSGNITAAKITLKVGLYGALIVASLNCFVMMFGRSHIARFFSTDPEVIKEIEELLPLVATIQIFDGLAAVESCMMRAQGLQMIGSFLNLAMYYLIAIPLSYISSRYFGLRLFGLWIGLGTGLLLIATSEMYYIWNSDWNIMMEKARDRNLIITYEQSDNDDEEQDIYF
ncbi:BA75_02991T0 [Komagataella pastoris]|uniref:BA75_02991T0 n=1 Tax=Komagataella pastoris TaxID=4922 RepID=A0A1B2JCH7_PICPA|nr:BA75_02991T0 [Komagataella pastoris]